MTYDNSNVITKSNTVNKIHLICSKLILGYSYKMLKIYLKRKTYQCITRLLENSGHSVEWIGYKEAGAQLVLRAFLQRVIHDGGRITREYPLRRRTDLLIEWPRGGRWDPGKVSMHVTEC